MSRLVFPDRWLWPAVLLLAVVLAVFETTELDLRLQDIFYDFDARRWQVDRDDPLGRAWFYNGPKYAIYALALGTIALLAGPARWRERAGMVRRDLAVAVGALVLIPSLIGLGKATINVYCPYEITRYGGAMPYVRVFDPVPECGGDLPRGGCFPAGHASGGFALLGLLGLRHTRRWRIAAITLAMGFGWWMGLYQILKGAHYLSHTLITMLVAWVVVLGLRRVTGAAAPEGG